MVRVWFDCAVRSATGAHRGSNQDSAAGSADLAVVADGVGGHAGGDVASATVVREVVAGLAGVDVATLTPADLRGLVADANAALHRRVDRDPSVAGLATTLTALVAGHGVVRVVHVGDSRAYRLLEGAGELVTHDDSFVQRLVDTGAIRESDAARHPARNVILRSLGGDPEDAADVAVLELPAEAGERWVVCSDGLTDALTDDDVVALATRAGTPADAADALLVAALDADARDNVTVVVCDVVAQGAAGDVRLAGAAGERPGGG